LILVSRQYHTTILHIQPDRTAIKIHRTA
jgi:hypothetical protein